MNGWMPLVDDIMTQLSARGVRPSPGRYAVVSYLVTHDLLAPESASRELSRSVPSLTSAKIRQIAALLVGAGIAEEVAGVEPSYRLLAVAHGPA